MPPKGYKMSTEARDKISKTLTGKKRETFSEQHKKNLSESLKNRKYKPGYAAKEEARRKKLKTSHLGHQVSTETRLKISKKIKGRSISTKGKQLSNKTKHLKTISMITNGTLHNYYEKLIGGFWYGNVKYPEYSKPKYCEKFNEDLKERVRAFFNYQCFECGTPQNGRKLSIHHVHYNKKMCCDKTPRSLVPLCPECHSKTNYNREYWSNHFQEILDLYYGGICWLTRNEYMDIKKDNFSIDF